MVRLRVTEQPDGTFAVATPEAIPTYVDRNDYVVLPVQLGLDRRGVGRGVETRAWPTPSAAPVPSSAATSSRAAPAAAGPATARAQPSCRADPPGTVRRWLERDGRPDGVRLGDHPDVLERLDGLQNAVWDAVDPVLLELCRLQDGTSSSAAMAEEDARTPGRPRRRSGRGDDRRPGHVAVVVPLQPPRAGVPSGLRAVRRRRGRDERRGRLAAAEQLGPEVVPDFVTAAARARAAAAAPAGLGAPRHRPGQQGEPAAPDPGRRRGRGDAVHRRARCSGSPRSCGSAASMPSRPSWCACAVPATTTATPECPCAWQLPRTTGSTRPWPGTVDHYEWSDLAEGHKVALRLADALMTLTGLDVARSRDAAMPTSPRGAPRN